jgi:hypothetical protein
LIGTTHEVSLEDVEGSVFDLLRAFDIRAPEYEKLRAAYYGTMTMSPAQAKQLRAETEALLARYSEERRREVQKEKRVHAQDPAVLDRILQGLLADDPWLVKLREILNLCDDATAHGASILCVGD